MTRLLGCALVVIAGALSLGPRLDATRAAMPPAGLDRVKILAGTWKADGQSFDTDFSKAGRDTSVLKNDCWSSGEFFACDQIVNGESKALIIFSYNSKDDSYNSYAVPAGGDPASSGHLKIDGNNWTYQNPPNPDSKPPFFRTLNVFEGATVIHYTVQFSKDNANWITMKQGVETKRK